MSDLDPDVVKLVDALDWFPKFSPFWSWTSTAPIPDKLYVDAYAKLSAHIRDSLNEFVKARPEYRPK